MRLANVYIPGSARRRSAFVVCTRCWCHLQYWKPFSFAVPNNATITSRALPPPRPCLLPLKKQACCPGSSYSIAADGTPITSSIGETAFPSVNTVDSAGDGMISAIGLAIADNIGIHDDLFVAEAASTVESVDVAGDCKGRDGSYGRSESSETQAVGGVARHDEIDRVRTTLSSEIDPDTRTEPDTGVPRSPQSPAPEVIRTARSIGAESTPGTDVE